MKLPGLPGSERGIRNRVRKDGWASRQVQGSGGKDGLRTEYQPPAKVMALIKEALLKKLVVQTTEIQPADPIKQELESIQAAIVNPGHLKNWQRDIANARLAICSEVQRLATAGGTERAIQAVIDLAARGALRPELQAMVPVANAKAGTGRALSRTTIYRWIKETEIGGSQFARLAPKTRETAAIPPWASYLLSLYGQPQKPSLAYCVEQLVSKLPGTIAAPSYAAAHRFIQKMSNIDRERGRMGSREIKTILPFVRRDTSNMWPADIYTADGHTFDAEVCHPATGKAFRPEITTVLDVATRRAVGWSAGLAESTWAVLDALRNACETGGIPAIFYVDNGSGYKNAAMSDESTGFMARLGIRIEHSLPYNSQARGIIERAHQTIWVRGAKMLPTYMGAKMDAQAKQKVFKITRKDIKISGTSKLLLEWSDFVAWCQQQVDDYNNRPHSSLPKIRAADGTKRHLTPQEAWQQAITEGWKHVDIHDEDVDDLFRPHKICKIIRGEVRLFNNRYFSRDLEDYHGETADVGYDIHDASRVWVKERRTGRLICIAHFEANKQSYMPQTVQEQADYQRAKARLKRVDIKRDDILEELEGSRLIEYQAAELPPMTIEQSQPVPVDRGETQPQESIETVTVMVERPTFYTSIKKYRWLMQNKHWWTVDDAKWLARYSIVNEYFDMTEIFAYEGIAWTKADQERAEQLQKNEDSAEQ